jgi:hypothetical protein
MESTIKPIEKPIFAVVPGVVDKSGNIYAGRRYTGMNASTTVFEAVCKYKEKCDRYTQTGVVCNIRGSSYCGRFREFEDTILKGK